MAHCARILLLYSTTYHLTSTLGSPEKSAFPALGSVILATKLSSAFATGVISDSGARMETIKAFQVVNRIVCRNALQWICTARNGLDPED